MIDADLERVLPWPAAALYGVIADVESYPEFMPGWESASVEPGGDAGESRVRQGVHLLGRRWDFDSRARFDPPRALRIEAGAPFRHFELQWELQPLSGSFTRLRARLRAELDDQVLDGLARHALPALLRETTDALERRAAALMPLR